MSFILDALKKSEKERQRSNVPGIGDLPVIVQYKRAPAWTITLITGLALALVALGIVWWRTVPIPPTLVSAPVGTPPGPVAGTEPGPAIAETPGTRSLATEATRVAEAAAQTTTVATAPVATRSPARPALGTMTAGPMSITEARSAGMPVPELELELLVFSGDPARRFVYINSAKYSEGDSLPEGPELVEITTEGAILRYRGQRYILPQN